MLQIRKILVAAAATLVAMSCTRVAYNDAITTGESSTVTICVAIPAVDVRGIGGGDSATNLYYTVFDEEWNAIETLAQTESVEFAALETQIELTLALGVTYNFTFWAANPAAPYRYDGRQVVVDYDSALSNDELRDAFFGTASVRATKDMEPLRATLRRPFAQLNFGTSDWEKAVAMGLTVDRTLVQTHAYTTLDLVTGKVDESTRREVTFAAHTLPNEALQTNEEGAFKWMAMNYVLVPSEDSTLPHATVEFYGAGSDVAISSLTKTAVPVRRNARTHIIGALLTQTSDYFVSVDAHWSGETVWP